MLKTRLKSKRGQAMFEFATSLLVFFVVIEASMVYFRILRSVTIKQEVVRNVLFAKIRNNGSLISDSRSSGNASSSPPPRFSDFGSGDLNIAAQDNGNLDSISNCLVVDAGAQSSPPQLASFGSDGSTEIAVDTRAIIYRLPGVSCAP